MTAKSLSFKKEAKEDSRKCQEWRKAKKKDYKERDFLRPIWNELKFEIIDNNNRLKIREL